MCEDWSRHLQRCREISYHTPKIFPVVLNVGLLKQTAGMHFVSQFFRVNMIFSAVQPLGYKKMCMGFNPRGGARGPLSAHRLSVTDCHMPGLICASTSFLGSAATFDTLTVQTPLIGDDAVDQELKIVLQFEYQLYIDTRHNFTFYRTIHVTDVQPRKHLTT